MVERHTCPGAGVVMGPSNHVFIGLGPPDGRRRHRHEPRLLLAPSSIYRLRPSRTASLLTSRTPEFKVGL